MSKRKLSNPNLAFGEEDVILEYKKKQYKQSKNKGYENRWFKYINRCVR